MKRSPMNTFEADTETPRIQVGALCWRQANGKVEILLATSRDTGHGRPRARDAQRLSEADSVVFHDPAPSRL